MEEMKSIYQVPITNHIIDLHYLICIHKPTIEVFSNFPQPSWRIIELKLNYRMLQGEVIIKINAQNLFNDWKSDKIVLDAFENRIRNPLMKAWQEYRKHMVE